MASERDIADTIASVITAWERKSKASMHLDGLLHPVIKAQLIQALTTEVHRMIAAEVGANARDARVRSKLQPPANAS